MDDTIRKANLALLEGDREEVLRLLANKQASTQVLWLRAHAVREEEQRLTLLRQISTAGHPIYSTLAKNILDRERQYESDLAKPAEYKFWTRPPWLGRVRFVQRNRAWLLGGAVLLLVLIVGVSLGLTWWGQSQAQALAATQTAAARPAGPTPRPTPSVTALAAAARASLSYPNGKLALVRIEFPTNRPVTFGGYGSDQTQANAAVGAQFVAVQLEFTCLQAICENPPEAELGLTFSDGSTKDYRSSTRPVLKDPTTSMARVSNNQTVQGWFVFEVPAKVSPVSLRVITGENSPVLELDLPK